MYVCRTRRTRTTHESVVRARATIGTSQKPFERFLRRFGGQSMPLPVLFYRSFGLCVRARALTSSSKRKCISENFVLECEHTNTHRHDTQLHLQWYLYDSSSEIQINAKICHHEHAHACPTERPHGIAIAHILFCLQSYSSIKCLRSLACARMCVCPFWVRANGEKMKIRKIAEDCCQQWIRFNSILLCRPPLLD